MTERIGRQPGLGLAGLVLVVPVALLLAIGAGGPEPSLLVLGPLVTFALPVVAMIGFWWEDWPGSRLRPGWSGLADTAVIVAAAVPLTLAGQLAVGRLDPVGVFDPTPAAGHPATFPATMPLAGAAFVAVLQLTLVSEGWPLDRLGRRTAGVAALAIAWGCAVAVELLVVDRDVPVGSGLRDQAGPLSGADVGALLVAVGVWQVVFFVALEGRPFARIARRSARLLEANATVIGGGCLTYLLLRHVAGWRPGAISAAAGAVIAAALLVAMLFEGWPVPGRLSVLAAVAAVSAVLFAGLAAVAGSVAWTRAEAENWVAYAGLNAIGASVILHVAIGRRWPFR